MKTKLNSEMKFSNMVAYFIKKHVKDEVNVSITNNTLTVIISPAKRELFTFRMLFIDEHVERGDAEDVAMKVIKDYREHILRLHFR